MSYTFGFGTSENIKASTEIISPDKYYCELRTSNTLEGHQWICTTLTCPKNAWILQPYAPKRISDERKWSRWSTLTAKDSWLRFWIKLNTSIPNNRLLIVSSGPFWMTCPALTLWCLPAPCVEMLLLIDNKEGHPTSSRSMPRDYLPWYGLSWQGEEGHAREKELLDSDSRSVKESAVSKVLIFWFLTDIFKTIKNIYRDSSGRESKP